jgi:hypothetical protein
MVLTILPMLVSCSTTKKSNPLSKLAEICNIGRNTKEVSGNLLIKARSKEAKGQFPAAIKVNKAQKTMILEVTNLVGGPIASIKVSNEKFLIKTFGKKKQVAKGSISWGGIPLIWSLDLFLGKIPCPSLVNPDVKVKLSDTPDWQLLATIKDETYRYKIGIYEGAAWPEELLWSNNKKKESVHFWFSDPDGESMSPKKWRVKSSKNGEVRVKWRDRRVQY